MRHLPRGIRNNNPGNIRRSNDPWQGLAAEQEDPEFFQFESAPYGIRALARILITYQDKYMLSNVGEIIDRWAPPHENDTGAYARHVAAQIGVSTGDTINVQRYSVMRPLVEAIIKHENGVQPYTDAQIDRGLALAGIEPPMKPLSKSRTIKGSQIAAAGGVTATLGGALAELTPALPVLSFLRENVGFAMLLIGAAVLIGVGYVVYARIDDKRKLAR